jgi:hypothetical protein
MVRFVGLCFGMLVRLFRRRQSLLLENLALRQQLVMLKRRHPRPSLGLLATGASAKEEHDEDAQGNGR